MTDELVGHDKDLDKASWGDGPWVDEPDSVEFTHVNFLCQLLRGPAGNWNGYVGVPSAHPDAGKDYDSVDVAVHGGLTYSDRSNKYVGRELPDLWWFGFDTAHHMDLMPKWNGRGQFPEFPEVATYKDLEYVRGEVKSLAEQLAARS